jgi:hypothetical protein
MSGRFRSAAPRLAATLGCAFALGPAGPACGQPAADDSPALPAPTAPTLWRHDEWLAGLRDDRLDLRNPAAVFGAVWERLPAAVRVEPTENYYYWQLAAGGRMLHGNLRLAVGGRERGELAIAYGEPLEFLDDAGRSDRFAVSKTLTAADGVVVNVRDAFTIDVLHGGRTVVFHLNQLAQEPPPGFPQAPGESFRQRVQDESGLRFLLLYQTTGRYFLWVLDETDPPPEHFRELAPDVVIGRRTGFVFWKQEALGGRHVLASVRRASLQRNDYHDGPFDQLADNFVKGDGLRPFLEEAMPWLRGRVDPWGNILDGPTPRRVALTVHGTHDRPDEALALITEARRQHDPLAHLSRGGKPAGEAPGTAGPR